MSQRSSEAIRTPRRPLLCGQRLEDVEEGEHLGGDLDGVANPTNVDLLSDRMGRLSDRRSGMPVAKGGSANEVEASCTEVRVATPRASGRNQTGWTWL